MSYIQFINHDMYDCNLLPGGFWTCQVGTCFVRYRLGPAVMPKLNETHWIYFLSLNTLRQMDFLSTILLPIIDTSIGSFHLISDLTWKARQLLFLIWKWIGLVQKWWDLSYACKIFLQTERGFEFFYGKHFVAVSFSFLKNIKKALSNAVRWI